MAKKTKYAIHPDFAHYPYFPMPFNAFVLGLLNRGLKLDTFLRQRKLTSKAIKHQITSDDGTQIEVLQFNPDTVKPGEKLPAILYYHGGGFVLGYASTHVVTVDMYAQQAHCAVFMVDYRLAPKHVFPKAFEDSYAALQWVSRHAEKLGIDANRIAVGGDSAGGTLAAALAQKVADDSRISKSEQIICGQMLVYPALDKNSTTKSATEFLDTPLWDGNSNKKMWAVYLRDFAGHATPAYASPSDKKDLKGLVPAYVENAEFDPLRDEADEYAKRLQTAGVRTVFNPTKGTIHGYDTVFTSDLAKAVFQQRLDFLKTIFTRKSI
jgi:acetyl esterase